MQASAATPPYFFVDGVWVDPANERISYLRGQFMDAWNDHQYKPHIVDAEIAMEVLDHRDNIVLLEQAATGKLQPGPSFHATMDAEGRSLLYLPDRPLASLPLF